MHLVSNKLSKYQELELKKYYNINNLEHIKLCLTAEIELTDDNFIILSGYGILSTKNNIDWDWGVVHTTDLCLLVGKDF